MKWLLSPFLWIGAGVVAVWVVYRIWGGKPVVLRGQLGPRVLRIVAILLVTFGLGVDDQPAQAAQPGRGPAGGPGGVADPAPPAVPASLPENLTVEKIDRWLAYQREAGPNAGLIAEHHLWKVFKNLYTRLQLDSQGANAASQRKLVREALPAYPADFAALIEADLKAFEAGKEPAPRTAKQILAACKATDDAALYDPWLIAYYWRMTQAIDGTREPEVVEIFQRLERNARVTQALYRARAQVQPIDVGPRAWMSKAGPGPNITRNGFDRTALAQMAQSYAAEAPKADAGPWRQDGVVKLTLAKKSAPLTVLRGGQKVELKAGEALKLDRLDLLKTPEGGDVLLEHGTFGKVRLTGGQTLLVWDLARSLDDDARRAVGQKVRDALDGREEAARLIEQALPLCQKALREELLRQPGAPGAAKMRLILALFDDAVMVVPPPAKPTAGPSGAGGPGGGLPGAGGPAGPPGGNRN